MPQWTKATFIIPRPDVYVYSDAVRDHDQRYFGIDIDDAVQAVLKLSTSEGTDAADELQRIMEDYMYQAIRDIPESWESRHQQARQRVGELLTIADMYLAWHLVNIHSVGHLIRVDRFVIVGDSYHVHFSVNINMRHDASALPTGRQYVLRRPL